MVLHLALWFPEQSNPHGIGIAKERETQVLYGWYSLYPVITRVMKLLYVTQDSTLGRGRACLCLFSTRDKPRLVVVDAPQASLLNKQIRH